MHAAPAGQAPPPHGAAAGGDEAAPAGQQAGAGRQLPDQAPLPQPAGGAGVVCGPLSPPALPRLSLPPPAVQPWQAPQPNQAPQQQAGQQGSAQPQTPTVSGCHRVSRPDVESPLAPGGA